MVLVDEKGSENRSLYWAGLIQLFYGIFELVDTVAITLIALLLLPNFYVLFIPMNTEIGMLLVAMPSAFIPVFIFFTSLRLTSAYWMMKNKAKGLWLALLVTGVTLVAVWFMLPFSVIDLIFILPFVILLFKGIYRETPIIQD
ncbi:MAG: hypothetical protein ACW98Y_18095 [Candidatus Thorarchaeota archaeon]